VAALALTVCAYILGYQRGSQGERSTALKWNIETELHFYHLLEEGDSKKLNTELEMLIYAHTEELKNADYKSDDLYFKSQYSEASKIAERVSTNLVRVH
jgi:hypothetical protein